MITLSFNSSKAAKNANRGAQEQEIRDIVDSHLTFPGSDKLKLGVTIKSNGATSVSFTGPQEAIAEARRLWRENVKPAAAKAKRTATKVRQTAIHATKPVKRKSGKKAPMDKGTLKPTTANKAAKQTFARAKSKISRKTFKKRKS